MDNLQVYSDFTYYQRWTKCGLHKSSSEETALSSAVPQTSMSHSQPSPSQTAYPHLYKTLRLSELSLLLGTGWEWQLGIVSDWEFWLLEIYLILYLQRLISMVVFYILTYINWHTYFLTKTQRARVDLFLNTVYIEYWFVLLFEQSTCFKLIQVVRLISFLNFISQYNYKVIKKDPRICKAYKYKYLFWKCLRTTMRVWCYVETSYCIGRNW